jgi:hypothetical protein
MKRKRRLSAVVKLQYEYQSLMLETAASGTIMSSVLDNRGFIFWRRPGNFVLGSGEECGKEKYIYCFDICRSIH